MEDGASASEACHPDQGGSVKIIGIPLTSEGVASEFMQAVAGDKILVSASHIKHWAPEENNDFVCAQAGYRYLISEGYCLLTEAEFWLLHRHNDLPAKVIVSVNAWLSPSGARHWPSEAATLVMGFLDRLQATTDREIGYICQGSPKLYDSLAAELIMALDCEVIDTPSSADLAYSAIRQHNPLPKYILSRSHYDDLNVGCANVIGSFGGIYAHTPHFLSQIDKASRIWAVRIGDKSEIESLGVEELRSRMQSNDGSLNSQTLIIEVQEG